MFKKSLLTVAAAGLALGGIVLAAPAGAAVTTKTGVLSCRVDSGWGFVFGSTRDLRCIYTGNGKTEHYFGSISKFGADIGYQQSGVIVWAVLAPSTDVVAGALAGSYGGATAGASVGVGANVNVLVGGSTHELSLQPLSIEGDKGINVAAGIAQLALKAQP